MKINRPNNWVWHQAFSGQTPHDGVRGTAYTVTADDAAADDRVQRLRDVVHEVTGMQSPPVRKPIGF